MFASNISLFYLVLLLMFFGGVGVVLIDQFLKWEKEESGNSFQTGHDLIYKQLALQSECGAGAAYTDKAAATQASCC